MNEYIKKYLKPLAILYPDKKFVWQPTSSATGNIIKFKSNILIMYYRSHSKNQPLVKEHQNQLN